MLRAVAAVLALLALAVAGCGEDEPEPEPTEPAAESPADPAPEPPGDDGDEGGDGNRDDRGSDPHGEAPDRIEEDELSRAEREATATVRSYIEALDDRDGAAVCELLVPGAIGAVELPRQRGGCASSLDASIGYRDPRGFPVWEGARIQGLVTVTLDGDSASVTATTRTRFADREEPSIEDDVVHLVRRGGRWLVAKPSSTLYRAVGIADVPPRVLAPPG